MTWKVRGSTAETGDEGGDAWPIGAVAWNGLLAEAVRKTAVST